MDFIVTKESFLEHLTLGIVFVVILLLFGDLLSKIFETFQKTKKRGHRYFFSTAFLLILFVVLRLLNGAYDMFLLVMNAKGS